MLCDICKENTATLHIKNNINGVITERDICTSCYEKLNANSLGSFSSALKTLVGLAERPKLLNAKCSVCGTQLSSVLDSLYMGCPNCYRDFKQYVMPSIKNVQSAVLHEGKRPLLASETVTDEYERLKNELNRAIAGENYEQAAIISARLKQLRGEQ